LLLLQPTNFSMILPILLYGDPVLRKMAAPITKDYPDLKKLIADMFETMYQAKGVGLAAPQIGKSIRLFIVDASPFAETSEEDEEEDEESELTKEEAAELKDFKRVFINPVMLEEDGEEWKFNEGCLSIPKIREDVSRKAFIVLRYMDENFQEWEEEFDGLAARIIQHEYDHVEGKLFTDKINPLRRKLLKRRLEDITKGKVNPDYKVRIPK
jgi:peptide deformylase